MRLRSLFQTLRIISKRTKIGAKSESNPLEPEFLDKNETHSSHLKASNAPSKPCLNSIQEAHCRRVDHRRKQTRRGVVIVNAIELRRGHPPRAGQPGFAQNTGTPAPLRSAARHNVRHPPNPPLLFWGVPILVSPGRGGWPPSPLLGLPLLGLFSKVRPARPSG